MKMNLAARCLCLASALLIIASTTNAQTPTSGGRRTELEYLERGFDLPGIDVPREAELFWDTPEGKLRYEQNQAERLAENTQQLSELGKEDWAGQYDSLSDPRTRQDFENRTEDLENVTDDMSKYFEWKFDAEAVEVDAPSEESLRDQLVQITPMVEQIVATISTLASGGIQVQEFIAMRRNLAHIHTLSQVLRD